MHQHHHHDPSLIILSIVIAIFASYTALDLTNSVSTAKGPMKWIWLLGGSLAMGVGIWSMHFIGMLAFNVAGLSIYYDLPLLLLSIFVAVLASALALFIVCMREPSAFNYSVGSSVMGAAIAGMHYIGIWSMRMAATISWDLLYVGYSILIAFCASYVALLLAFKLRNDLTLKGFLYRGAGGVLMGFAIAGMHYTAMAAMHITPDDNVLIDASGLLASDSLAAGVIVGTLVILGIALSGSNVERALSRKTTMNEALQTSLRARDEFISVVSHELKTPLTSIKLQNDLVLRNIRNGQFDGEKILSQLEKSGNNIDRINRLVDDMLDISRMSTLRMTLQKEVFDMSTLISEVIERMRPLLDQANSQVIFDPGFHVSGEWDRFRIEQVITNLLSNACKYAPGKPISIHLELQKEKVLIRIADQGKGIALEDQERIFRRFERAESEKDTRGLGLGLYITREIVTMHSGEIKVVSRPNQGSEFMVILPLAT
ncbi:MAG: MHYT domain-containing protein [Bdellovibrionota bacterium]